MGILRITTKGSFSAADKAFSAQTSGHAVAVHEAVRWLTDEYLPKAVEQDRQLRAEGAVPTDGFAEADKRGLLGAAG